MTKDREEGPERVHGPNPIQAERFARPNILNDLGMLGQLAGTWNGPGFNLIARPDFHHKNDLYLQLNHTRDHIHFEPIPGNIPNRGFGQDDINLFGLTYLQRISDATLTGAGIHIEPGIWVTLPGPIPPGKLLSFPPDVPPTGAQLVARMATIPHGNSLVIEGYAAPFNGEPAAKTATHEYNGSLFPSFNTTPIAAPPSVPPPNPQELFFNAAGSSERLTAAAIGPVALPPFPQYDLSVPVTPGIALPLTPVGVGNIVYNPPHTFNTRTNFDDAFAPLGNTPDNQALLNDPIVLLQRHNHHLKQTGHTFHGGTVINIATQRKVHFNTVQDNPAGPTALVNVPNFGGSEPLAAPVPVANTRFDGSATVPNIQFLLGDTKNVAPPGGPVGPQRVTNAQTAMVYATFWISKVTHHHHRYEFLQLQYAQMVVLNFPVFHVLNNPPNLFVNLGWPHVTVGSLRKEGV